MMGGVGGFRLFMHLLQRMLAESTDSRYHALRAHGERDSARMFGFFVSKAISATLFSLPLFVAANNPLEQASNWTLLAAAVYSLGLAGETYADIQLAQFREQPRHVGRTCRRGLWRYSRHPNYFFALVHWCSYALLAVGLPWPLWSLTLLGPVLTAAMAFRRIPVVEAHALDARGEDYLAYQRTTSVLVPWFPAGWPNEVSASASWYTPPPQSKAQTAAGTRGTPLPGARITPSPASRLPALSGPTTPRPQRVLDQRVLDQHAGAKSGAEPPSVLPTEDIES
jgi:steroid 5-alpha reductase family enzyme